MKAYIGQRLTPAPREPGDYLVEVTPTGEDRDRRPLEPRLDLHNHSPDGFAWGYSGSGPAQLALAILADYTGDDAGALALYQAFKAKAIATLDGDRGWKITGAEIDGFLASAGYQPPTVAALMEGDDYKLGGRAIEYVEEVRGLCRAFTDGHGRRMVRVLGAGLENREPVEAARGLPAKLVRHDGAGGNWLPRR